MLSIKSLIERLGVFERNKVPLELKILGLAFYIQLSSLRRAARANPLEGKGTRQLEPHA
jgi:hypothetical protein